MMILRCPSCSGGFEMSEQAIGVKATVTCPLCARVVVIRDAGIASPGAKEATIPFDTGTEAGLEQATPADEATAVGGRVSLALPAGKRVSLAILTGPRKGDVVAFERARLIVGREGGEADLQLADAEVSRNHAAVECLGSRVVLRDLGSRNGTFVGTDRVDVRELEDHGEFRVGGTVLMLIVANE